MGGNVVFDNHRADIIYVNEHRDATPAEIVGFLEHSVIDELFLSSNIDHDPIYVGSTRFLLDDTLTLNDFVRYKQCFGDIDMIVDVRHKNEVQTYLESSPSKLLGWKKSGTQFITLWCVPDMGNIQIDVQFVSDVTDPWSTFSKYASWEDQKRSIKGVYHKMMLRALTSMSVQCVNGVHTNTLAFSAQYGLRRKFELTDTGWGRLLTPRESYYITNLYDIHEILFGAKSADISDMYSVLGLTRIMNRLLTFDQKCVVMAGFLDVISQQKFFSSPRIDMINKNNTYLKLLIELELLCRVN